MWEDEVEAMGDPSSDSALTSQDTIAQYLNMGKGRCG